MSRNIILVPTLSGLFSTIEDTVLRTFATSFCDDCNFLMETEDVSTLVTRIQEVGSSIIDWGDAVLGEDQH